MRVCVYRSAANEDVCGSGREAYRQTYVLLFHVGNATAPRSSPKASARLYAFPCRLSHMVHVVWPRKPFGQISVSATRAAAFGSDTGRIRRCTPRAS
jgi:hypothetical protein